MTTSPSTAPTDGDQLTGWSLVLRTLTRGGGFDRGSAR
ncbi:MAG: hypothetical protein JWM93_725 [Frankiales bacterium]|nr:hypothetical protein [Frankiales bacterium]